MKLSQQITRVSLCCDLFRRVLLLLICCVVILAAGSVQAEGPSSGVVNVFRCKFDKRWDINYDQWPDRWTRKQGKSFPHYVEIGITHNASATESLCLSIKPNGGNATLYSPSVPVNSLFSYRLDARINLRGLRRDHAQITIDFYDKNDKLVQTIASPALQHTEGWTNVTLGPFTLHNSAPVRATIGLHLRASARPDLAGEILFDDIRISRLPRIVVKTNNQFNVFTNPEDVSVICEISGIHERDPLVQFELLDASSNHLKDNSQQLKSRVIVEETALASKLLGIDTNVPEGYAGNATWQPKLTKPGYYRVRVTMFGKEGKLMERTISLAVIRPLPRRSHGEFGWSLPSGDQPKPMEAMARLLPRMGIHWVKVPVWYSLVDETYGDRILRFTEQLATSGIEMIGVIDIPPVDSALAKQMRNTSAISDVLSHNSSSWSAMLDPIMTRLSLRVRWWQLGADHDTSFVGYPEVQKKLISLREQLFRFGQDVKLGIAWEWVVSPPEGEKPPWEFLQFAATPGLTGQEIGAYLDATPKGYAARWVLIEPLEKGKYSQETRARDLVAQMLAVKIHNAEAAFIPKPFDSQHGLMNADGTPGELLLPWRTTASLLGGSKYLGSIQLPNHSQNRIFRHDDGTVVMVVWSDQETKETIYLGESIQEIDIWGREVQLKQQGHRQVIRVGTMPVFLLGLSEPVAKWRMATHFENKRFPSTIGKRHPNTLTIQNAFAQGCGGTVVLVADDQWRIMPDKMTFKVSTEEKQQLPFTISLKPRASSGKRPVRIDFDFTVDKRYRFSVYRHMEVGLGDITVEISNHFDKDGTLVIEQRMVNRTGKKADFRCYLYAQNRRRQRRSVFQLSRGQDIQQYRYRNGKDMIGQELWLEINELSGSRVMNYRFKVEK